MKSPKLLRPLFLGGMLVIFLAVISLLFYPDWSRTPLGIAILLLALGVGIYAVVKDMRDLMAEVRAMEEQRRKNQK